MVWDFMVDMYLFGRLKRGRILQPVRGHLNMVLDLWGCVKPETELLMGQTSTGDECKHLKDGSIILVGREWPGVLPGGYGAGWRRESQVFCSVLTTCSIIKCLCILYQISDVTPWAVSQGLTGPTESLGKCRNMVYVSICLIRLCLYKIFKAAIPWALLHKVISCWLLHGTWSYDIATINC